MINPANGKFIPEKFAYIKKIIFESFLVILDRYKISSSILAACINICIEKSEKSEKSHNSHNSHISHVIFCKIYIVHFCPIIGTTFSVHSPTCHAACIKIYMRFLRLLRHFFLICSLSEEIVSL